MTPADDARSRGATDPLKVSIIVPTYQSGPGLDRVLESLDRQSMPQHDFESIFVDDGSPDDTHARLEVLARSRPNMRVTSIEHSGWPSRPRNVGLRMARGGYVVFMDHDDELYPTALADAWAFAVEHELDALTAKETKGSSPYFSWEAFRGDVPGDGPKSPQHLSPMTPHKMYDRCFLLRHGIEFPESGPESVRVPWEDIHFNIDVYTHSDRLGVLASRPFYHWRMDAGPHLSASFDKDPEQYLQFLGAIFDHLEAVPIDEPAADWIRANNYAHRVLSGLLGPRGLKWDDGYYARALELATKFAENRVPVRVDGRLEAVALARSTLLRSGHGDKLRELAEVDRGVRARPVATEVRMVHGQLHVSCTARWTGVMGNPVALSKEQGRLVRVLPSRISRVLPSGVLDVSAAFEAATSHLSVGKVKSSLGWPLDSSCEHRLVDLPGDRVAVEAATSAVLDIRTTTMGHPLDEGRWRVACRSSFAGFHSHPNVAYRGPEQVALVDGRVLVARSSSHGNLVLDVGADASAAIAATHPDIDSATVRRARTVRRLVVPVDGVSSTGATRLPVRFRLREVGGGRKASGAGHLVGDLDGARLELDLGAAGSLSRGRYRLIVDGPGQGWGRDRGWVTEIVVRVGRAGRLARLVVDREPLPPGRRRPVWG